MPSAIPLQPVAMSETPSLKRDSTMAVTAQVWTSFPEGFLLLLHQLPALLYSTRIYAHAGTTLQRGPMVCGL